jgi:hypothetical protein
MRAPVSQSGAITTTSDRPSGDTVVLRAGRDAEGAWTVGDCATTRFGYGSTLREALSDYLDDLDALMNLAGPFAPPLKAEVEYARKVLDGRTDAAQAERTSDADVPDR